MFQQNHSVFQQCLVVFPPQQSETGSAVEIQCHTCSDPMQAISPFANFRVRFRISCVIEIQSIR